MMNDSGQQYSGRDDFTIKHNIYARHSRTAGKNRLTIPLIKHCIRTALRCENVDFPCEVSVLITSDRGISEINRDFRGVNKSTDVLSFPMQEFSPPGWAPPGNDAIHPETGLLPLGDIVLSAESVDRQAYENYQTREHETAYLTVHSVLHLLGYDHIDEAEGKKLMRAREKEILRELGYN